MSFSSDKPASRFRRIRFPLMFSLLLATGVAQAFSVSVNSVNRTVGASAESQAGFGFFNYSDAVSYAGTGAWADGVAEGELGDGGLSAELTSSYVPESGSYSLYELSMAGSLIADSSGTLTTAQADLDTNVTFDADVRLVLSCFDAGIFGGTSVSITGSGGIQCGEEIALAAGTHDLNFQNYVAANFGGLSTYEFDATLSITAAAVPVPAAVWLFGSALAGLGWFRRRQTA